MKRPILATASEEKAKEILSLLARNQLVADLMKEEDEVRTLYSISVDEPEHGKVLELIGDSALSEGIEHCPECNSIAVEYPARARASGIANAVETVISAIAPPRDDWFHCRSCAHFW